MEENVKKGFNKNILVISLVVVVALAVVLFILFNHVNPRKYYETGLNNLKTSLTTNVNKIKGNYTGVLDLSMATTSKDSVKKILGDIDLNLVYGYDYNNKSIVFNVKSNYQNDKLVNGNIYLANNKVYFR